MATLFLIFMARPLPAQTYSEGFHRTNLFNLASALPRAIFRAGGRAFATGSAVSPAQRCMYLNGFITADLCDAPVHFSPGGGYCYGYARVISASDGDGLRIHLVTPFADLDIAPYLDPDILDAYATDEAPDLRMVVTELQRYDLNLLSQQSCAFGTAHILSADLP